MRELVEVREVVTQSHSLPGLPTGNVGAACPWGLRLVYQESETQGIIPAPGTGMEGLLSFPP